MTGETMYELYREERIQQGWQEFLWKSMSRPQQLVWEKLAARVESAQTQPPGARPQAAVTPFVRRTPQDT